MDTPDLTEATIYAEAHPVSDTGERWYVLPDGVVWYRRRAEAEPQLATVLTADTLAGRNTWVEVDN